MDKYLATRNFNHLGVEVVAGQEITSATFTPDDLAGLIAKGLIKPATEKAETPKAPARRKTK